MSDAGLREGVRRQPYRADIDGLRALAVLLVVAFHAFPGAISGGFIGVDVFFVISGYLISGIIMSDLRDDRFSFRRFFAGRVRRILPAMTLVVACTLIVGWRVLWPDEYQSLGRDAAGAVGSVVNLLSLSEHGYFDSSTAVQPLLHLWSLGIEEQFYLAWPPLLLFAWRRRIPLMSWILTYLAASLVVNLVVSSHNARWAFYLPVTRVWELLIGAALAWSSSEPLRSPRMTSTAVRNAASIMGFVALILSAAVMNESMSFPGWWAILPSGGAALIIAAGRDIWLNRWFLAHPAVVSVGLISYPIYLWHWPMLSFGRILNDGPLSSAWRLAIVAMSIVAAWLTYILLDKPIRFGIHTRQRLAAVVLATLLTGGAALMVRLHRGYPMRSAEFARVFDELDRHDTPVTAPPCPTELANLNDCAIRDGLSKPTAAIVGDSHARRLFLGLAPALEAYGENLLVLSCSGCASFYDVYRSDQPYERSASRTNQSLDFIAKSNSIRTVFIVSRGPVYIVGQGYGPQDYRPPFWLIHAGHPEMTDATQIFAVGMRTTLIRLQQAGKRVVFVTALPELGFDPRSCFAAWPRRRKAPCEVRMDQYRDRSAAYLGLVSSVLHEIPGVHQFTPTTYLCDGNGCPVVRGGHLLYCDHTHLSLWGSRFLAGYLASASYPERVTAKRQ